MQVHKVIGSGSYGAVVEPALPNVDEHGHPVIFGPDKVTKIMLKRNDYLKTLADAKTIADKIPSLATNIIPYRRTYTEQNIAGIPHMQSFINSQDDRNGVFMMRMPNLGTDLWTLQRSVSQMATLRSTISPTQMIRQILKLMRIVKSIGSAGYIHADIRETNVLCNKTTGDLTIIDFDWMMTPTDIQKSYPVYFYCHPPESMFLLDSVTPIDGYLKSKPDRTEFRDTLYDLAVAYMKDAKRDEFWKDIQLHGTTRDSFAHRITANMMELYDTAIRTSPDAALKRFRDIYYHTADSFGLAVALKNFVVAYFHRQEDTDTRRFLRDTLFTAMTNTASKQRMKIERAIIALQDFARINYPDIQLGEEISFAGEMSRMGALMNLMSEKRKRSEERRTLRQQVEGLALVTKYLEGITTPKLPLLPPSPSSSGRRTGSSNSRKTRSRGGRRTRRR
jgi:hypothetical protein